MKTYETLQDIIGKLFEPYEIVVFWGKRGNGKSSLQGHFMSEFMKPRNAKPYVKKCKALCDLLNEFAGFNFHPPKDHLVFCDTSFKSKGCLSGNKAAYVFDPLSFGLPNDIHPTLPTVPFGQYNFDEASDLFDSHMGALATFVTKQFELSRQLELFITIALQRPMRLHKDLRALAVFVECVKKENIYNKYGRLVKTIWFCNIIRDNAMLEKYLDSKDEKYIDEKVQFVHSGNIYDCYDDKYFLPMFYKGFENTDFVLVKSTYTELTAQGFEEFSRRRTVEIPETYRGKKPKTKG